jgi:hypothetical protein
VIIRLALDIIEPTDRVSFLGGNEMKEAIKEALPQMVFIAVLVINLLTSLIDQDRKFMASFIATLIMVGLTYWGGFYKPLMDLLAAAP